MKESESVKEYGNKLMTIVNQIKLLGEDFPTQRIVEKLLVSLPEMYESKISSLEDSKDLSKISFVELINALQAVDQRRTMRREANEQVVDVAYLAKESKGKERLLGVIIAKKLDMKRKIVGTRESLNGSSAKDLGIYKKIIEQKWNKQMW